MLPVFALSCTSSSSMVPFTLQIKEESFLEDINNVLQSGEVPNLYGKDEVPQILDGIRKPAKQAGVDETTEALWAFFVDRCAGMSALHRPRSANKLLR